MTTFSIVVPVYNVEKYIKKCLDSIKNQTFTDFEVLLVDDCGQDSSVEIIENYAKEDNRFKIIHHEHNQGVAQARNTAFDAAQGEYLVCVDPDDWINERALEKIYEGFEKSNADSVWFNSCVFNEKFNNYSQNIMPTHKFLNHTGIVEITPERLLKCTDYVWDKAYRRSKINELGMRFPIVNAFEDCEFYFKLFTQIRSIYYINEMLYIYRIRQGSLVTEGQKGNVKLEDLFNVDKNIYDYIIEKNIFDEQKNNYLFLIGGHIKTVLLPNQYEKAVKLIDELLTKINFPEAFASMAKETTEKSQ